MSRVFGDELSLHFKRRASPADALVLTRKRVIHQRAPDGFEPVTEAFLSQVLLGQMSEFKEPVLVLSHEIWLTGIRRILSSLG